MPGSSMECNTFKTSRHFFFNSRSLFNISDLEIGSMHLLTSTKCSNLILITQSNFLSDLNISKHFFHALPSMRYINVMAKLFFICFYMHPKKKKCFQCYIYRGSFYWTITFNLQNGRFIHFLKSYFVHSNTAIVSSSIFERVKTLQYIQ
jgi:hypothetical protein